MAAPTKLESADNGGSVKKNPQPAPYGRGSVGIFRVGSSLLSHERKRVVDVAIFFTESISEW
jgi:hypothetical protein